MLWLLLQACSLLGGSPDPEGAAVTPRPLAELRQALAFPGAGGDPDPSWRGAQRLDGYQAQAVALDVRPGFRTGAVLYQPDKPDGSGAVIVAPGHFGA